MLSLDVHCWLFSLYGTILKSDFIHVTVLLLLYIAFTAFELATDILIWIGQKKV